MALYIEQQANIFEIEEKETKTGNPYVVCNVVFYSKSKDRNGKYTVDDKALTVKGVAFGKAAKYLLKRQAGENVFVTVLGRLQDTSYAKEGKTVYTKRFDILTVAEVKAKGAETEAESGDYEEAEV